MRRNSTIMSLVDAPLVRVNPAPIWEVGTNAARDLDRVRRDHSGNRTTPTEMPRPAVREEHSQEGLCYHENRDPN